MHCLAIVLIEVMVNVTDEGGPSLANASELVLKNGDSAPVTSTCCPRYGPSFILPVLCSTQLVPGSCLKSM